MSRSDRVNMNRRRITKILILTWIAAVLTTAIPSLFGLVLREATQAAYTDCALSGNSSSLSGEFAAITSLAEDVRPLNISDENCHLIAPTVADGGSIYDRYTVFTNFPFRALTVTVRSYANQISTTGELMLFMMIIAAGVAAALSAAITTVNSLMILSGQLLREISLRWKCESGIFTDPWWTTAGFGLCTLAFTILPIFSDRVYLSIGVFAWASMTFLGLITLFITFAKDENAHIARIVSYQFWAFLLWVVLIVVPHFWISATTHSAESLTWYQGFLAVRSVLPITALILSLISGALSGFIAFRQEKISNI